MMSSSVSLITSPEKAPYSFRAHIRFRGWFFHVFSTFIYTDPAHTGLGRKHERRVVAWERCYCVMRTLQPTDTESNNSITSVGDRRTQP